MVGKLQTEVVKYTRWCAGLRAQVRIRRVASARPLDARVRRHSDSFSEMAGEGDEFASLMELGRIYHEARRNVCLCDLNLAQAVS